MSLIIIESPPALGFQTVPSEDAVKQCRTHQLPQSVPSSLGLHAKPGGLLDFVSSICSPPDVWTSSGSISASRKLDPCMKMRLSNDHLVLQMHCHFCRQCHEARNKVMHKFVTFPCLNFCHLNSLFFLISCFSPNLLQCLNKNQLLHITQNLF